MSAGPTAEKKRFPLVAAMAVADALVATLTPHCERIVIAGSLRRRKAAVGDVEILYIPKRGMILSDGELLGRVGNLATVAIEGLVSSGVLDRRRNVKGSQMWGPLNKFSVHVASGIPVDLFGAHLGNWWNYLVCRTGPAESNTRIATEAQRRGWKWNPYGCGFSRGGLLAGEEETYQVTSEPDVFRFVGLPCLQPEDRK